MKARLGYLGIAIGVLLLILIALPFFISVEFFRPMIEQQLSSAMGRKVEVGTVGLSIFSSALTAENLAISDDPSFNRGHFLTAKRIKVSVEMWPLLTSRKLTITGLTIENPEVNLVRDRHGQSNFSTVATGGAPQPKQPTNRSSPSAARPKDSAAPEFLIAKLKLENGRVTVSSMVSDRKRVYDNVELEATNLSTRSQFPVKLTAKLPGGGDFKADGRVGPIHQTDAALSPLDMKVNINGLDLEKTGFLDPAAGIKGIVDVVNRLQSNNGRAHANGSVKMNKLQLVKGGASSTVPVTVDFDIDYDLQKNMGVLTQGVVKIGNAVSHLTGTFEQRGESTTLDMKLNGQDLPARDLQAALPAFGVILPKGSSLETGTLKANLNVQGPIDKLVTTGTLALFKAKLAGFDMGSKMSALSAFSGIQKSAGDTSIEKLTTSVRVAPEGIRASDLELLMPAIGQLNGGGTISSSNALNLRMVATLSSKSGVASAIGTLTGRGMSKNARIPFLIQGTTSDPKFVPDVGAMVGGAVESELGNVLGNNPKTKGLSEALGGLFGGKKDKNK